jgi:hypothetical protein
MWGTLNVEQTVALRSVILNQTVHDLGAASMGLSRQLVQLGAAQVVAVDLYFDGNNRPLPPTIRKVRSDFSDYYEPIDIAFASWPLNRWSGIEQLIARAPVVIYLGSNSDGNACGSEKFWDIVTRRQVIAHVPHRENTLIIYGAERERRRYLPEEYAAVDSQREGSMWISYTHLQTMKRLPFPPTIV